MRLVYRFRGGQGVSAYMFITIPPNDVPYITGSIISVIVRIYNERDIEVVSIMLKRDRTTCSR